MSFCNQELENKITEIKRNTQHLMDTMMEEDNYTQKYGHAHCGEYKGYVTDNLYVGGLLEQMSSAEQTKDVHGDIGMALGVRKYKLNRVGEMLLAILSEAGYFNA